MALKRFRAQDLIYNTIVAKPECNFIIQNGFVFLHREKAKTGDFSNNVKHASSGEISLYEMNINRPSTGMVRGFVEKTSDRVVYKSVTTSSFNSENVYAHGEEIYNNYPLTASLSRIYVPAGREMDTRVGNTDTYLDAHENKKYIRALKNVLNMTSWISPSTQYGSLGTKAVNMLCAPGIFYGSSVEKGSVQLDYYVTGTLTAQAKDVFKDGRLIGTHGPTSGSEVGLFIYNQGIALLTESAALHGDQDKFFSTSTNSSPSWLNFGTGIPQTGSSLLHGTPTGSSYSFNFKGTNRIPTMTMFAHSEKGEHNYSTNPTFLVPSSSSDTKEKLEDRFHFSENVFIEKEREVKKINKSFYSDHEEEFENVTYISKVGIYDKDKNLIAVVSLANPIKKTEKRDFMIKMKLDF